MSCIENLQQIPEKIQTKGGDEPVLDPPILVMIKLESHCTSHVHISQAPSHLFPIHIVSTSTCNSYFLELNAIINTGTFTIFKEVKRHFYLWISMTFKLFRNIDFSCVEINRVQFLYRIYANYAYELFVTFVMRSSCFWMWRSLACLEPSTLGISCQGHHCIPM